MIFLNKIIVNGFKSFATKTAINFDKEMSGIVGPNGSGKSNIVDAIRWVLGEKSNKNLRSKVSEDVIFHGSEDNKSNNFAEVTLEFNNYNNFLHFNGKKLIITRKLIKGQLENEYYINSESCRLKDIQNIFLDTGLTKGSLGIISQGTVQWFVDAKPEDRRTIFEDAAGIGSYTKKRDDANNQLNKVQENLNRVNDIINELSNSLNKLKCQAEKAKLYNEKIKQLKILDITIMVKDLKFYTENLQKLKDKVEDAKDKINVFTPSLTELIHSISFAREKEDIADKNIETLTQEFNDLVQKINHLEIKKSSLHSQFLTDLNSENIDKKINAFKNLINSTKFTINDAKNNVEKLTSSISTYNEIINNLTKKRDEISHEIDCQTRRLIEIRTIIKQIIDSSKNNNLIDSGIRAVIDNKSALTGIVGLVSENLKFQNKYSTAISVALGKNINNIIVEKKVDAENAIDFLKMNQSGKATFLPIDSIKPKIIRPEHIELISSNAGYLGIAKDLIEYDQKFDDVFGFLLGNIIIANDLQSALLLSRLTYQLYRVITLDGDFVSPGGSVTGGYNNKNSSINQINSQVKLDELNAEYPIVNEKCINLRKELEIVIADLNEANSKQSERKILLSHYEEILKTNENQLIKYESDYKQLLKSTNKQIVDADLDENKIASELANLNNKKNKIFEELNVNRSSKALYKSQIYDQEAKLNQIRFQVDEARDVLAKNQAEVVKCESIIENNKSQINKNYHMTIEYAMNNYQNELPMSDYDAREIINKLRDEISRLGSINMDAINELEDNQKRYNDLISQQDELKLAKSNIEKVIVELDNKAKESFAMTIDNVNKTLPSVFNYLFGGGKCEVKYTNPDDILTSGIDVIVAPFGKKITRLSLLSGGEKSLVALSILFTILKIKNLPLIILDEAESALDPANVERFANMIQEASEKTQFIVITHRPGTMERCNMLYGATMQTKGITSIYHVELSQAKQDFANNNQES